MGTSAKISRFSDLSLEKLTTAISHVSYNVQKGLGNVTNL